MRRHNPLPLAIAASLVCWLLIFLLLASVPAVSLLIDLLLEMEE